MFRILIAVLVLLVPVATANASQIHFYDFSSGALDSIGTAHGTLMGGANVTGGYLNLNGSTAFVQFSQKIVPSSGSYTVALFAFESQPTPNFVELISQGSSGVPGFYIGHDPGGNIRVTDSWSPGVSFPSDGALHHFALVVDSGAGTSRFYIDGSLVGSVNFAISTSGATNTRFGRQFDPFGEFFNGGIDDVRIYDHALSASEIANLSSAGPSAIPEPSTMVLLGTGLAGALNVLRRRRKS
jgi:hypothetical protein